MICRQNPAVEFNGHSSSVSPKIKNQTLYCPVFGNVFGLTVDLNDLFRLDRPVFHHGLLQQVFDLSITQGALRRNNQRTLTLSNRR